MQLFSRFVRVTPPLSLSLPLFVTRSSKVTVQIEHHPLSADGLGSVIDRFKRVISFSDERLLPVTALTTRLPKLARLKPSHVPLSHILRSGN